MVQYFVRLLYLLSSLFVFFFFSIIAEQLFKKKASKDLMYQITENKHALMIITGILVIALVVSPINFYLTYSDFIPQKTYTINTILKLENDTNKYAVPAKVEYFEEEYVDAPYPNSIPDRYIVSTFRLLKYKYHDYEIIDLPEEIESNAKYEVEIVIPNNQFEDAESDYVRATIEIPVLTADTLGVTKSDQLNDLGVTAKIEHSLVFGLAFIELAVIYLQEERLKRIIF